MSQVFGKHKYELDENVFTIACKVKKNHIISYELVRHTGSRVYQQGVVPENDYFL